MNQSVIDLTRGNPPTEVFPVEDLIACEAAALRRDAAVLLQYSHGGYRPLREWIGAQVGVGPEQVLTGNGSPEILAYICHLLGVAGRRAFVESPSWDRAITLLRHNDAVVVGIPLEGNGVDVAALEAELERGAPVLMYVITDFQNPMGVTTSLEKRERLAALARRHDFWIIEDSPYRPLRYAGEGVPSLWSLAPDRVLLMSSFSKTLAPGLRLAYLIGPPDLVTDLSEWAVHARIGPVLPTQGMVYEYCRRGLLDGNVERLKAIYRPRLHAIRAALEAKIPDAEWTRPEGGFFVSGFLPEGTHIVALQERARSRGLRLSDGRGFFPTPSDGDRFLRIPFCGLTETEIREGVDRLARLINEIETDTETETEVD